MSVDLRQCVDYQKFMRRLGWVVEGVGGGQVEYVKRLPFFPLISVMKIQRVKYAIDFSLVNQESKKYRVLFIKLEPKVISGKKGSKEWTRKMRKNGFKEDKTSLLATKTRRIDLRVSEKKLLEQMKSKTRYNIGLAERRGIKAQVISGEKLDKKLIDDFYKVFKENSKRIKILTYPRGWFEKLVESFGKNCFMVMACDGGCFNNRKSERVLSRVFPQKHLQGAPFWGFPNPRHPLNSPYLVGVALFLVAGDTVYYSHNGTTDEGRKNFGSNLMVWEGVREAKRRKLKWFDFGGVYDSRYKNTKNWKGFSRFKQGFGGEEVTYLGSFVKWLPFLRK